MSQIVTCILLLEIIANTETTKPRSVNLALETVLAFDNKDRAADVKFIDDVQNFLAKVRKVIDTKTPARRVFSENNMIFSNFLTRVIDIFKTYDDDDLEDIFAVLNDEIRKYHYKGCKFYELVEDHHIRRYVAHKLDSLKEKPANVIRNNLRKAHQALEEAKSHTTQSQFLEYINSLYNRGSNNKLKSILDFLEAYKSKSKRVNLDLVKFVRNSLRNVIFDHYSNLNVNARRDFKMKAEAFWKDLTDQGNIGYQKQAPQHTKMDHNKIDDNIDASTALMPKNRHKRIESNSIEIFKRNNALRHNKLDIPVANINFHTNKNYKVKHFRKPKNPYLNLNSKASKRNTAYTKSKRDCPKKRKHKVSSFITLYPEEITFNTKKRFKIIPTTADKPYISSQEKSKKGHLRNKKTPRQLLSENLNAEVNVLGNKMVKYFKESDENIDNLKPWLRTINRHNDDSESDLSVQRKSSKNYKSKLSTHKKLTTGTEEVTLKERLSSENEGNHLFWKLKSQKNNRYSLKPYYKQHKIHKSVEKAKEKDFRSTVKKYNEYIPTSSIASVEEMSEDSYKDVPTRSFRRSNDLIDNFDVNHVNEIVMKRINDLEKQIREVRSQVTLKATESIDTIHQLLLFRNSTATTSTPETTTISTTTESTEETAMEETEPTTMEETESTTTKETESTTMERTEPTKSSNSVSTTATPKATITDKIDFTNDLVIDNSTRSTADIITTVGTLKTQDIMKNKGLRKYNAELPFIDIKQNLINEDWNKELENLYDKYKVNGTSETKDIDFTPIMTNESETTNSLNLDQVMTSKAINLETTKSLDYDQLTTSKTTDSKTSKSFDHDKLMTEKTTGSKTTKTKKRKARKKPAIKTTKAFDNNTGKTMKTTASTTRYTFDNDELLTKKVIDLETTKSFDLDQLITRKAIESQTIKTFDPDEIMAEKPIDLKSINNFDYNQFIARRAINLKTSNSSDLNQFVAKKAIDSETTTSFDYDQFMAKKAIGSGTTKSFDYDQLMARKAIDSETTKNFDFDFMTSEGFNFNQLITKIIDMEATAKVETTTSPQQREENRKKRINEKMHKDLANIFAAFTTPAPTVTTTNPMLALDAALELI